MTVHPFIDGVAPLATLDLTAVRYRTLDVPRENDQLIDLNYCFWNKTNEICAR